MVIIMAKVEGFLENFVSILNLLVNSKGQKPRCSTFKKITCISNVEI